MIKNQKYPRNKCRRALIDSIIRGLLWSLADLHIEGLENIPKTGPVILAGNHVEYLEAGCQVAYPKRVVEPIGAGDIPFDKGFNGIVNFYGFIPINRGTVDRAALREAQAVLEQGAALSIFPEGGTWRPGKMPAQIGVALLSERGQAPVVPIGYSGFIGAVKAAISFKRPKLTMRIGKPIPAMVIEQNDLQIKEQMQAYANEVMRQVYALLDESELNMSPEREEFQLTLQCGNEVLGYETLPEPDGSLGFANLVDMKIVLDTLKDSLQLPVKAFYPGQENQSLDNLMQAIQATLAYLEEKPAFFTYRMGHKTGEDVPIFLKALLDLAKDLKKQNKNLKISVNIKAFYRNGEERLIQHDLNFLA